MTVVSFRAAFIVFLCAFLCGCGPGAPQDDPWRVTFEDRDAARIAVCRTTGADFTYVTPDSLEAHEPVTDSSWMWIYFRARPRGDSGGLHSVWMVRADGSGLRRLTGLPMDVVQFQVTPQGSKIIVTGKYPDDPRLRAYTLNVGEPVIRPVSPSDRPVYDPSVAPGGLNFVWHDSTMGDTLWVSELNQTLTLPIFPFPYTDVSISPDAEAFAAVCGERRRGLCHELLRTRTRKVLVEESDRGSVRQPIFHPRGDRVAYVWETGNDPDRSALRLVDINSLEVKEIPMEIHRPRHPAWVR